MVAANTLKAALLQQRDMMTISILERTVATMPRGGRQVTGEAEESPAGGEDMWEAAQVCKDPHQQPQEGPVGENNFLLWWEDYNVIRNEFPGAYDNKMGSSEIKT